MNCGQDPLRPRPGKSTARRKRQQRGVSEWRKIWANGRPNEGRSPKSGQRIAAKVIPFPWRSESGTISTNLDVIWKMSVESFRRQWKHRHVTEKCLQNPELDGLYIRLYSLRVGPEHSDKGCCDSLIFSGLGHPSNGSCSGRKCAHLVDRI